MRNLGGAIGIALIDTVLYGRTKYPRGRPSSRLLAGDMTTARAIGLDPGLFASGLPWFANAKRRGLRAANDRKGCFCLERQ
jgi:hypothetical protein